MKSYEESLSLSQSQIVCDWCLYSFSFFLFSIISLPIQPLSLSLVHSLPSVHDYAKMVENYWLYLSKYMYGNPHM